MNNHNFNKPKTNNHPSHTKNYSPLFFAVSKPWPSGFERRLKKYGWFSSGCTKQVINPELNHISTPELNHHSLQDRRSRPLAQALPILNGRWYSSSQKHAFTIIEVVLVLAIADLIFLMVFIALPALQRSQRDNQRKRDVGRVIDAVKRYQANNQGRTPRDYGPVWQGLLTTDYLKSGNQEFRDPDGTDYVLAWYIGGSTGGASDSHNAIIGTLPVLRKTLEANRTIIWIFLRAECDGSNTKAVAGNDRVALSIVLEGGGVYCANN